MPTDTELIRRERIRQHTARTAAHNGDPATDSVAAQMMFEAMFDHAPRVDLRTPADVAQQSLTEGWRAKS